jgi:serine/threonine protein phosphatase PrpC
VRSTNEDCFALDERLGFCIVADGMGGHNGGDVASRMAVESITGYFTATNHDGFWPFGFVPSLPEAANLLRTAVHIANLRILDVAAASRALSGMGTTVVAAILDEDRLWISHVGDSRFYMFSGGILRLLTSDDSWALSPNVLTNVLGTRPNVDVHVTNVSLAGDEIFILTTDGVHATLDDARMQALVAEGGEPARTAARLVRKAISGGSRDNCTALVARVERPS